MTAPRTGGDTEPWLPCICSCFRIHCCFFSSGAGAQPRASHHQISSSFPGPPPSFFFFLFLEMPRTSPGLERSEIDLLHCLALSPKEDTLLLSGSEIPDPCRPFSRHHSLWVQSAACLARSALCLFMEERKKKDRSAAFWSTSMPPVRGQHSPGFGGREGPWDLSHTTKSILPMSSANVEDKPGCSHGVAPLSSCRLS